MEVLIVSKAHTSHAVCVGGLVLKSNRNVRLLTPGNLDQPTNTKYKVGEIYKLSFRERTYLKDPHIEDVVVSEKTFLRRVPNMSEFLAERNIVNWHGHIDHLFYGLLSWTDTGIGYIPIDGQMPTRSVGFWTADKDLLPGDVVNGHLQYRYPDETTARNIPYIGIEDRKDVIPAGTIIRVSLSRMFPPEESELTDPCGYYLELSGWYVEGNEVIWFR